MDWLFGYQLISALQAARSPLLDWLFIFFTFLGEDIFYIGLISVVFWCINKKSGVYVAYLMLFGFYVNYFFKMLFSMDRPPDAYRIIEQGNISHGFPSGHAQSATIFWTCAALKTRRRMLYIVSPILIFMISLSRIYLGVHYPGDVIGGFIIGLAFVSACYVAYPSISEFFGRYSPGVRQAIVPVIALALFGTSLIIFPDTTRDDPAVVCGALFGFSSGLAFESRYVNFKTEKMNNKKRIMRLLIGLFIVGILYVGLSAILPSSNVFTRFARYTAMTFAAAFMVPLIFSYAEGKK